jgi:hypothetical protein
MIGYTYNINDSYENFVNVPATGSVPVVSTTIATPPSKIGRYNYVGCFSDSDKPNRALPTQIPGAYTMESCVATAQNKNFSMAGLQAGNQCWVGSSFDKSKYPSKPLTDPTCNYKSPGAWTNVVYENFNLPPRTTQKSTSPIYLNNDLNIDNGNLCFIENINAKNSHQQKKHNCINGDYILDIESRLSKLESKQPQLPTPQLPTPQLPTPQLPTPQLPQQPQLPTPQLPTPQLPTPQLPTPQLPTPQLPTPQLPQQQPAITKIIISPSSAVINQSFILPENKDKVIIYDNDIEIISVSNSSKTYTSRDLYSFKNNKNNLSIQVGMNMIASIKLKKGAETTKINDTTEINTVNINDYKTPLMINLLNIYSISIRPLTEADNTVIFYNDNNYKNIDYQFNKGTTGEFNNVLNPRKFPVINSMKVGKAYGIFINDEDLPLTILSGNYVKEFRRDDPNYRTIRIMPSKISYSLEQYN